MRSTICCSISATIVRELLALTFAVLALTSVTSRLRAAERPNVVWILSEDNSIHWLRLYGYAPGVTPNIEQLAADGVTFEHAFSNAPVCSVARTTLMSGILAPRVGFQYHRRSKPAHLPPGAQLFPALLKQAGYYTTNNSKKDYNVIEGDAWHASSNTAGWRDRPSKETPFFHMQTTTLSHESSLHFSRAVVEHEKTLTDPATVTLAPYHPDTPTFRYTYARYFDRMRAIDLEVGKIVDQLHDDGLLDNTFIFYFGDHGGVLPRGKGYAYESGLHVPLVVRVPENWRHLVDRKPGSRANGFVSFIDFGPTVLNLAGIETPQTSDGRAFLGNGVTAAEVDQRDESFGYADRFDEKYDLVRTLRKGRYRYIRNYQPFNPDGLHNNYRYRMLAYQEWRELYETGKLNAEQRQFFEARPAEQLFDVEADPHEVRNLANDPQHAATLRLLRTSLQLAVKTLPDLSLFPEPDIVVRALEDGAAFGSKHRDEIASLVGIADLQLKPFNNARDDIRSSLNSENSWQRYWGLIVCSSFGKQAAEFAPRAKELSDDPELLIRVRAAEFLGITELGDPQPALKSVLKESTSDVETLLTFNTIVLLRDHYGYEFDIKPDDVNSKGGEVSRRLEYLGITKPEQPARATKNQKQKQAEPSAPSSGMGV
jgi:arylsulfatase A-like enzyme